MFIVVVFDSQAFYVISIFHRDATSINSIDLLKLFK